MTLRQLSFEIHDGNFFFHFSVQKNHFIRKTSELSDKLHPRVQYYEEIFSLRWKLIYKVFRYKGRKNHLFIEFSSRKGLLSTGFERNLKTCFRFVYQENVNLYFSVTTDNYADEGFFLCRC